MWGKKKKKKEEGETERHRCGNRNAGHLVDEWKEKESKEKETRRSSPLGGSQTIIKRKGGGEGAARTIYRATPLGAPQSPEHVGRCIEKKQHTLDLAAHVNRNCDFLVEKKKEKKKKGEK